MSYQGGCSSSTICDDGFSMDCVQVGVVGSQNLPNLGNSSVVVHPQVG